MATAPADAAPLDFIGDLEIVQLIFTDVISFSQGNQITGDVTIEGKIWSASVVNLPNGPAGTPYQVISGSITSILFLALTDATALIAGTPLMVAIKIKNAWTGLTLVSKPAA